MGSIYPQVFKVKRIAVIGAGPCGLAAAKYLQAQGTYENVSVFEQQAEVGGVWNYKTELAVPATNPIPQTDAFYPPDEPAHVGPEQRPVFPSPMYDDLHANITKTLMKFSDVSFPKDSWIFPSQSDIQDYVIKYSSDVRHLIRFCFRVNKIRLLSDGQDDRWQLEAESTRDGSLVCEIFDAVVVANGHFSTPFVPNIRGIAAFHKAHPSIIIHSKNYRSASLFKNKKTIVVGNGPSGLDIAYQVNRYSKGQTLLSVRHTTPPKKLEHTGCREIAEIQEFLINDMGVRLRDGSIETDVEAIICCTGFRFSLPFLLDLDQHLITNGTGVHGLYKHIFHIQHPTLVFSGLNVNVVPFPNSESQAAVFSAVWSNNLELPPKPEMVRWNREAEAAAGDKLHWLPNLRDAEYLNELHDWAMSAAHLAKEPPRWGDEEIWNRTILGEAKVAFENNGRKAKTLDELGFSYKADD